MTVSNCYSIEQIIAAITNADSYINKAADTGQFYYVDIVIDAGLALQQSRMSDEVLRLLYYRWVCGFTQRDTGLLLDKTRESVAKAEERARKKIAVVLEQWGASNAV